MGLRVSSSTNVFPVLKVIESSPQGGGTLLCLLRLFSKVVLSKDFVFDLTAQSTLKLSKMILNKASLQEK